MKRYFWEFDFSSLIPVGWLYPLFSRGSGLGRRLIVSFPPLLTSTTLVPSSPLGHQHFIVYHVYGWSWCQKGANIMLLLVGSETTDFHILFTASKHHHSSKTCQLSKNFFSTRTLKFISGDRESSCESSFKI